MSSASSTEVSTSPTTDPIKETSDISGSGANPIVSFEPPMRPADVYDKDKYLKLLNIPRATVGPPLKVPEVSDDATRRQNVAAHVGRALILNKNLRNPSDKYRPSGPIENITAWRIKQKLGKLSLRNSEANTIAESFSYVLTDGVLDSKDPRQALIDSDTYKNLSFFEKSRARKNLRRYIKLKNKVRRLEHGHKIVPGINSGRPHLGFEQIVNGGEHGAEDSEHQARVDRSKEPTRELSRTAVRTDASKVSKELGDIYFSLLADFARLKANPNASATDIKAADEKAKAAFEKMFRADITNNL